MAVTTANWGPLWVEDDTAHARLAHLIEETGQICAEADAQRCGGCGQDRLAECRERLSACGHRLMELLLHHLAHEEKLLGALPCTAAAWSHRARHREHHHEFVTGYNRMVMALNRGDPADHVRRLETLVASWARDHVLAYETELAALLAGE